MEEDEDWESWMPKDPHVLCVDLPRLQPTNVFHTPGKSQSFSFGDGGDCDTNFGRIAVCPELLPRELLNELAVEMEQLAFRKAAIANNTMQQNGVVEDLVDPDYFPALQPRSVMADHRQRRTVVHNEDSIFSLETDYASSKRQLLSFSEHRGQYHWIPALVHWDHEKQRATFTSAIQNLPRTKVNQRLYALLEEALSKMMPTMLSMSDRGDLPQSGSHRVVVKLQRYHLPPGACYKGQWHTEGVCEGVHSVGVLYAEWPAELTGGALKFRPLNVPDDDYRKYVSEDYDLTMIVPAKEGTALAFGNLPHRFQTLTNATDKTLQRAFVNFFLVDPSLPSLAEVPTNADVALAILRKTNYDVVDEVLQFLGATPRSIKEAVDLREKSKAEMVAMRGRWGYYHHGNSGEIHWLSTGGLGLNTRYSEVRVEGHCAESAGAEDAPSLTSGN